MGDESGGFVDDDAVHEHAASENRAYRSLAARHKTVADQQAIQPFFLNGRFRAHGTGGERCDAPRRAPQGNQEEDSSEESSASSSGEKA